MSTSHRKKRTSRKTPFRWQSLLPLISALLLILGFYLHYDTDTGYSAALDNHVIATYTGPIDEHRLLTLAPEAYWLELEQHTGKERTEILKEKLDLAAKGHERYCGFFSGDVQIHKDILSSQRLMPWDVKKVAGYLSQRYGFPKSDIERVHKLDAVAIVQDAHNQITFKLEDCYAIRIAGVWYITETYLKGNTVFVSFPPDSF